MTQTNERAAEGGSGRRGPRLWRLGVVGLLVAQLTGGTGLVAAAQGWEPPAVQNTAAQVDTEPRKSSPDTARPGTTSGTTSGSTTGTPAAAGGATAQVPGKRIEPFSTVKFRADRSLKAIEGVVVWQAYLDSGVTGEEREKAEAELKIWNDRVATNAVLMNRKWLGGEERKSVENRVKGILEQVKQLIEKDQTVEAVQKLEEASKIWPENYKVAFQLGFIALGKRDLKEATARFEQCLRVVPNSPAVLNNLGVCYMLQRGQMEKAILTLAKSVKLKDSRQNVQNLVTAIDWLQPAAQRAPKYKDAVATKNLLEGKYELKENGIALMGLQDDGDELADSEASEYQGIRANGSGFVISSDGLILTNKHVADAGEVAVVQFDDGTRKTAELVVRDDEQDLALFRVKLDKPLPYVKFAGYTNPPDAANVLVMGYPLATEVGFALKTTRGIVSAGNNAQMTSDVTLDVRVNPGNSGGPVYNEYGNVVAIIAQKTLADVAKDTYGLAISNGRIWKFLKKNNVKFETAQEQDAKVLSPQQIAEQNRQATVLILLSGKPKE